MLDSRELHVSVGPVISRIEGPAPNRNLLKAFTVHGRGGSREAFPCYRPDQAFYTGILPEVLRSLKDQGLKVTVTDKRVKPRANRKWKLYGLRLRDYQERVARRLVKSPLSLVRLPSAAGKSVAALAALRRTGAARALYLTDRLDLAFQFADVVREHLKIEPGFVGAGRFKVDSPLVVASVDSAAARLDDLGRFDLTIADEAHSAAAPTYFDTVVRVGSYYRLALTATPFRSRNEENLLLRALFGAPVEIAGIDELEKARHVARPKLRLVRVDAAGLDLTLVWRELEEALVNCRERNDLIIRETRRLSNEGHNTLVLVRMVRHGEILQKRFSEAGGDAPLLTGKMAAGRRHEILRRFREERGGILIGTDVLAVGVDIPSLGGVVLAGGQHAKVATLQKVGRVMRVSQNRGEGVKMVVDFDDSALHPTLGRHSIIREKWMAKYLGIKKEEEECA